VEYGNLASLASFRQITVGPISREPRRRHPILGTTSLGLQRCPRRCHLGLAGRDLASFPAGTDAPFPSNLCCPRTPRESLLLRRLPRGPAHATLLSQFFLEKAALGTLVGGNALCDGLGELLDRRRDLPFCPLIQGLILTPTGKMVSSRRTMFAPFNQNHRDSG
jgi:hypothetical protein